MQQSKDQPSDISSSAPVVASTPQAVVDRMFVRMVTCAVLPISLGLVLLVFFYFQKVSAPKMFIAFLPTHSDLPNPIPPERHGRRFPHVDSVRIAELNVRGR